jgi:phosphotransferase system enzyme I (PtsP)
MSPAAIGPVKAMLAELPLARLEAFMEDELGRPGAGRDTREALKVFAEENGIPL